MRIYMATNVFRPKVGGVTRSIEAFSAQFRARGHEVRIIAPGHPDAGNEAHLLQVPSLNEIWEGGYSLPIPYPGLLMQAAQQAPPDIVHAHHPFLLGHTGHKLAASVNVPIVYTHHSRFDAYGNYFPKEHGFLQSFVVHLSVHFANLCDAVIAPGTFIRNALHEAGVTKPLHVIPTGVDVKQFAQGNAAAVRRELGIAPEAPVVGHVGRLAREKNLDFLAEAVARAMGKNAQLHFAVVGDGGYREKMERRFDAADLGERVHFLGMRSGQELVDAYHAMDVFAFSSKSETQGMVITEAMAAGLPVVALNASGVEDVVVDGENGRLLSPEDEGAFAAAINEVISLPAEERRRFQESARRTADDLSIAKCGDKVLALYEQLIAAHSRPFDLEHDPQAVWDSLAQRVSDEWQLLAGMTRAAREALFEMSLE